MEIAVADTGYVGLSNAVLLSQNNEVVVYDIVQKKVDMINAHKSPIVDAELEEYLQSKDLHLVVTTNAEEAFNDTEYVIISTPTNYDTETNYFDTSTVPVGYTCSLYKKYEVNNILFSSGFLREGRALYDNLYLSRIIVGYEKDNLESLIKAKIFADLLEKGAIKKEIPILFTNLTEAEAVKLFANTYLALRTSFFNKLDIYAVDRNLETKQIIEGLGLDPRIGLYYNNPSFGYGG